jgi:hypothetical protein
MREIPHSSRRMVGHLQSPGCRVRARRFVGRFEEVQALHVGKLSAFSMHVDLLKISCWDF